MTIAEVANANTLGSQSDSPGVTMHPPVLFASTLLVALGIHLLCPLVLAAGVWVGLVGAALVVVSGALSRWTLEQLVGYFSTWSATNRFIKTTGHNPLRPLRENLKRVWGDAAAVRLVMWPLSLRIGRL